MAVSFLNTHRPAMFNVCARVLTLLCPLPFLRLDFGKNYLSLARWTDCREPHSIYLTSDCVDLCSEFAVCIC